MMLEFHFTFFAEYWIQVNEHEQLDMKFNYIYDFYCAILTSTFDRDVYIIKVIMPHIILFVYTLRFSFLSSMTKCQWL